MFSPAAGVGEEEILRNLGDLRAGQSAGVGLDQRAPIDLDLTGGR
jgi:hypothetical protein